MVQSTVEVSRYTPESPHNGRLSRTASYRCPKVPVFDRFLFLYLYAQESKEN